MTEEAGAAPEADEIVYQVIQPVDPSVSEPRGSQAWVQLALVAAAVVGLGASLFLLRKKFSKSGLEGVQEVRNSLISPYALKLPCRMFGDHEGHGTLLVSTPH